MIIVRLEPEDKIDTYPKLNTVQQLLNKYDLFYTDALVIRDGELLTQDRKLNDGDEITLRKVISVG
ncbi:ubiquitin family protein [Maridesulfovibrio frigidus]|uniref:hypothetical protein n=1 Tax=Maridesulfovibrio frigidus TaxID=340956 RepID=UPI0004E219EB|nr:hypothetical protein [Maridesulfovibrio frigidus]